MALNALDSALKLTEQAEVKVPEATLANFKQALKSQLVSVDKEPWIGRDGNPYHTVHLANGGENFHPWAKEAGWEGIQTINEFATALFNSFRKNAQANGANNAFIEIENVPWSEHGQAGKATIRLTPGKTEDGMTKPIKGQCACVVKTQVSLASGNVEIRTFAKADQPAPTEHKTIPIGM